ncbi:BREX-1 system adenine-specific DNA-methyltransferase PglX [Marinilactibacillus sp. Marseille-P9653]|uniref:BREX-1 system adenine-specific DNA-methyltransferase PglX n=1 Tax=Marinilactibacillus sp. Marseille-P9653 TaxID=2866583 RepID=UPI001CE4AE71|nr:BREX-1 system adenine-specific DNA-methyltransferase PglX [Marinilactibacillus sp. Marseille-P9653]
MNKTALKVFATQARKNLIKEIKAKAKYFGINEDGTFSAEEVSGGLVYNETVFGETQEKQYRHLKNRILLDGYEAVMEEATYTWFNRLIALRYMEINDYLPINMRILSSSGGDHRNPDALKNIMQIIDELELDRDRVYRLFDQGKTDELYQYLLINQSNILGKAMPTVFGHIDQDIGLLLPNNLLSENSFLNQLVTTISEEDWKQVEIVGWLYQYYVTEDKNAFFANKSKKAGKEDIGPATQLFTPKWIVQYMVDNSLGRYWLENHPDDELKSNLEYYLEDAEQIDEVKVQLEALKDPTVDVENIKFLDPSCGSGHILVYAFEVFHKLYLSRGYRERDIPKKILENNLFGLDIDKRAAQLATFAVVMKAREYDRRLLNREWETNIYGIEESNHLTEEQVDVFSENNEQLKETVMSLLDVFYDAKLYGSIIQVPEIDIDRIRAQMTYIQEEAEITLETSDLFEYFYPALEDLINQYEILSSRFEIVVTNPPYLNRFESKVSKYVNKYFADYKKDMFSVFMYVCSQMTTKGGYNGFMTPFVWMFISSYEKLRNYLIDQKSITNLIQMEYSAFEDATVPLCTFVIKNNGTSPVGQYVRLADFKGGMTVQEEKYLEAIENSSIDYLYTFNQQDFNKIPGSPIAYWASQNILKLYVNNIKLGEITSPRKGNSTSNNHRFLRFWYEVIHDTINFENKKIERNKTLLNRWYPYNKGGGYRKWFGNNNYIIDWYDDAKAIRNIKTAVIANYNFFMKPGLTWSTVSSSKFSIRKFGYGFIFDNGGCCIFNVDEEEYILGLLNSKVFHYIFGQINPTLNFQSGEVSKFPIILVNNSEIISVVNNNILLCEKDWDSFESSWGFKKHSFIEYQQDTTNINDSFNNWNSIAEERFNQLKQNEEELNQIFIDIYGLQEELTPEVDDKDVTVRKADLERDVKSFLSYLIGIVFGRYSLDQEGLSYAGGDWNQTKYVSYQPDMNNIIPITEEAYFQDDIVKKIEELLSVIYSEETLEENLLFIAEALSKRANESARERIRRYFQKEFFKDHKQIYKNRPIYWMFSSGKRGAFKGLIYLHRYDKNTIGRMRTEYVLNESKALDNLIALEEHLLEDEYASKKEKAAAQKTIENYHKDKKEIVEYAELLDHLARQQIELDLDDGVLVNYNKFQDIEVIHPDTNKKSKKNSLEKL